jgi:hypothetical protein
VGNFFESLDEILQVVGLHTGVIVEQEDIFAARFPEAQVVSPGKTQIFGAKDEFYFGVILSDKLTAGIGGGVVHKDGFKVFEGLGLEGVKAGSKPLQAIPVDNNNRNLGFT